MKKYIECPKCTTIYNPKKSKCPTCYLFGIIHPSKLPIPTEKELKEEKKAELKRYYRNYNVRAEKWNRGW